MIYINYITTTTILVSFLFLNKRLDSIMSRVYEQDVLFKLFVKRMNSLDAKICDLQTELEELEELEEVEEVDVKDDLELKIKEELIVDEDYKIVKQFDTTIGQRKWFYYF